MLRKFPLLFVLLFSAAQIVVAHEHPKNEFRAVWLSTAWQSQYVERSTEENKEALCQLLDLLQKGGFNAVIFQVRPQADAFYNSSIEPWSAFLTGTMAQPPSPLWDPMQFMIEQCHERNIEFHAWINPYRVTMRKGEILPAGHIYYKEPQLFVEYADKIYFDPGNPRSRQYILSVVGDIAKRYDIDALHIDDYFYPYPVNGMPFPDDDSFAKYGNGMSRSDWRRDNVNRLIFEIDNLFRQIKKPWIQLGISPFGIYRNVTSWEGGSNTNGLQCYDDLYADVLLWAAQGWIDYIIPQLYWTFENKIACYDTLVRWWNNAPLGDCHLYIGQHLQRSVSQPDLHEGSMQLDRKIELSRYLDNVGGDCFWYGYQFTNQYRHVLEHLRASFYSKPALIPAYTHIDSKKPNEVRSLKATHTPYGYMLEWRHAKTKDVLQQQIAFAVYRFGAGEEIDLSNTDALCTITRNTAYLLPYKDGTSQYTYVVTAIDRCHNESKQGKRIKVSL